MYMRLQNEDAKIKQKLAEKEGECYQVYLIDWKVSLCTLVKQYALHRVIENSSNTLGFLFIHL